MKSAAPAPSPTTPDRTPAAHRELKPPANPPLAFGAASFVMGIIGLMLFFLPILGGPISALGIVAGITGCFIAGKAARGNLRWSVAGIVVSGLALGTNVAINYAPAGYTQPPTGPPNESVPDRPYVPPPSRWRVG